MGNADERQITYCTSRYAWDKASTASGLPGDPNVGMPTKPETLFSKARVLASTYTQTKVKNMLNCY
jgi:hypothetical protein